jgi:tetratricopeptide (TPR) repeat protein
LHERAGALQVLAGEYREALASFQAAASLAGPERLPSIEHEIGGVYLRTGAWRLAEEHFARAIAQAPAPEGGWLARVLTDQCLAAHRQGRQEEARELADKALRLAEDGGDAAALAQSWNIAGVLASGRGEHEAAVVCLSRSVDAAGQLSDLGSGIAARNNLALVLRAQGRLEAAEAMTLEALEACKRHGDRHREAALRNNLADLWREMGRVDDAMQELKTAVAIFAEIGSPSGTFEPEIWKLVEW